METTEEKKYTVLSRNFTCSVICISVFSVFFLLFTFYFLLILFPPYNNSIKIAFNIIILNIPNDNITSNEISTSQYFFNKKKTKEFKNYSEADSRLETVKLCAFEFSWIKIRKQSSSLVISI